MNVVVTIDALEDPLENAAFAKTVTAFGFNFLLEGVQADSTGVGIHCSIILVLPNTFLNCRSCDVLAVRIRLVKDHYHIPAFILSCPTMEKPEGLRFSGKFYFLPRLKADISPNVRLLSEISPLPLPGQWLP